MFQSGLTDRSNRTGCCPLPQRVGHLYVSGNRKIAMDWNLILEYLKVLLSAPVMGAVVAITFLVMFKDEIRKYISRIASIKFPGGAEVSTSQAAVSVGEAREPQRPLPHVAEPALPAGLTAQQQEEITQLLKAEKAASYLWEYRYLNRFLVYQTQQVLDWLVSIPQPITTRLYDTHWLMQIPKAEERTAILFALQAHHLLQITGEKLEVTEKGREYQEWRGALPPLPAA